MSDLISREALIQALQSDHCCGCDMYNYCVDEDDCYMEEIFQTIRSAPTIETEEIFYDGYAYCLMDFGKDTVLCKDCKHYKQSAVADRKMCFRKDVDGIEVCYNFLPNDSCTYGEREDGGENE